MKSKFVLILVAALAIGACERALTKDEEFLMNATMFLMRGIEDGTTHPELWDVPVKRIVHGRTVEWLDEGLNPSYGSKDEKDAKYATSRYVENSIKMTQVEKCVFSFLVTERFSKGGARQYPEGEPTGGGTLNLNNVRKMELDVVESGATGESAATVKMSGRAISCSALDPSQCKDEVQFPVTNGFDRNKPAKEQRAALIRRERAIEFVRKACPGLP